MPDIYETEDTSAPIFAGPGRVVYPFADNGESGAVVIEQEFLVRPEDYEPLGENAEYDESANLTTQPEGDFYYVGDSQPSDADAGLVKFTRSWASVPTTRLDYETYSASFPGRFFTADIVANPISKSVTSQLTFEYFLVGTGQTYATAADIPAVAPTTFAKALNQVNASDVYLAGDTSPTLSAWVALVSAAEYSYIPEPSELRRYRGNIWARVTRRVRPQ